MRRITIPAKSSLILLLLCTSVIVGFPCLLSHLPKDLGFNNRIDHWDKDKQKSIIYPVVIWIYREHPRSASDYS